MAHLLFVNVASHGLVFPTLAVVTELVRRGHRVSYVTAGGFAEPVAAAGATVVPYASEIIDADAAEVFGSDDLGVRPHLMYLRENLSVLRATAAALDDDIPDLVLYDDFPFIAGQLLAARWDRPAGRLSAAFASNEHYSFSRDMIDLAGTIDPLDLPAFRDTLRELLAEHGLSRSVADCWQHVEDLNLVFVPKAFQIAGETFDDRFVFVGPCFGPRRFLGRWTPPADDRPIVLVSLGTTFNDRPDFFRDCARAFAGQPWHVVMTLGGQVDPAQLGELPPNVEVHRWVPHVEVLERAAVCVTHGGMGTLMEALHWGRPLVVVPQSFDVWPMARRVDQLGLGVLLPGEKADGDALLAAVDVVAADSALARRVAAMRAQVRQAGGAGRAADAIEGYLARPR
ncbi:glycosyl transferase [Micromonospora craterilacus]|uniref:Glycosyl transferase n=1 Tax=Micromonospora craterilacus TaxID=1655439 RepID=A0A2W2F847_9ACTN|nr:macrolide family glycosyltransferase [Micromonospora craterilacus]PZG24375.1 glycosyl transferase [Micromonospora craterilacus]